MADKPAELGTGKVHKQIFSGRRSLGALEGGSILGGLGLPQGASEKPPDTSTQRGCSWDLWMPCVWLALHISMGTAVAQGGARSIYFYGSHHHGTHVLGKTQLKTEPKALGGGMERGQWCPCKHLMQLLSHLVTAYIHTSALWLSVTSTKKGLNVRILAQMLGGPGLLHDSLRVLQQMFQGSG